MTMTMTMRRRRRRRNNRDLPAKLALLLLLSVAAVVLLQPPSVESFGPRHFLPLKSHPGHVPSRSGWVLRAKGFGGKSGDPGDGSGQDGTASKIPSPREEKQLALTFTCNKCEGRHSYMINREAYQSGVVICECRSCGVRHLIADNNGLMGDVEFGKGTIQDFLCRNGREDEVKGSEIAADLREVDLKGYTLEMGEDGTVQLKKIERGQ